MKMMWLAVLVLGGCKDKAAEPKPDRGSGSAVSAPKPIVVVDAAAAVVVIDAAAPIAAVPVDAAAPPAPELPLSTDILPRDEATPNGHVVMGDGFRFQVPPDFAPVAHDAGLAYTGVVKGFGSPATLTFWATNEPFTGTLAALTDRETKAAIADKAAPPEGGPVIVLVAGKSEIDGYARRLTIKYPDRIELRTIVVHKGHAYIHHCSTPNEANAWANVGSDCIVRGLTFHIDPPALKPKAAEPPHTPGVVQLGSEMKGTGRIRADVEHWIDDGFAPYVKPCLVGAPNLTTWSIVFDIGKDGKLGKPVVSGGPSDKPGKPASTEMAACVAKVIDGLAKVDGSAKGSVRMTEDFMVNASAP